MAYWSYSLIFIGGGIGSVLRFAIGQIWKSQSDKILYATLAVNILASFVLGLALQWGHKNQIQAGTLLFLTIGFCGGLSTFSSFSAENLELIRTGQWSTVTIYILLSLTLCLMAVALGNLLGKAM